MEFSESELIFRNNRISRTLGWGDLKCDGVLHNNDGIKWTFTLSGHLNGSWSHKTFEGKTSREALMKMHYALQELANRQILDITTALGK